ncbi:MAG: hypothetical protein R6W06_00265 [Prochlorococcaceae cyanobacterium]
MPLPHRAASPEGLAATIAALQAFPRIRHVSDAEAASFVAEDRR